MKEYYGCGSFSCIFGGPKGPGKGGPCSCLEALLPIENQRQVARGIQALRQERFVLLSELEAIKLAIGAPGDGSIDNVLWRVEQLKKENAALRDELEKGEWKTILTWLSENKDFVIQSFRDMNVQLESERDALRAELAALRAENEQLKRERIEATNRAAHFEEVWSQACQHVAEACEILGVDPKQVPADTWTLREHCVKCVAERRPPRI